MIEAESVTGDLSGRAWLGAAGREAEGTGRDRVCTNARAEMEG
jgi:hypothetical protein